MLQPAGWGARQVADFTITPDAMVLAYHMVASGQAFKAGEGFVKDDVEEAIKSICKVVREVMKTTEPEILKMMIES